MTTHGNFSDFPVSLVHRLIEPGPLVMVSTSDEGSANLMTNGFNMPVAHGGLIAIVLGPWDFSFSALEATGECVIAVPSIDHVEKVVDVGNVSGAEIDKWSEFGFTQVPATEVGAPLVGECFANIECRVADDRLVDEYSLWLLRPVRAWMDESLRGDGEFHHRGDGTFSPNATTIDLKARMTKWRSLTV